MEYSEELHNNCLPFLDVEEATVVLAHMTTSEHEAGERLFAKGDSADALYVLVDGRVAVKHGTGFGDRMQVVALLDPGAPVGESGLLAEKKRGATVDVIERARLLVLSREDFTALQEQQPALAIKILERMLDRVSIRLQKNSTRLARVL